MEETNMTKQTAEIATIVAPTELPAQTTPSVYSHYAMHKASELPEYMSLLPTALPRRVYVGTELIPSSGQAAVEPHVWLKSYKAIESNDPFSGKGSIVAITSDGYEIVQHSQAFRPILEALTVKYGDKYLWDGHVNARRCSMRFFVIPQGFDGVALGFSVTNSFDRSTSLSYGFEMSNMSDSYIELVGYRQVCSNGMKIRVPLDQAEFVRKELRVRIESILSQVKRIIHTSAAKKRIEEIQYISEAMVLLQAPVEAMIKKAMKIEVTHAMVEDKIKQWVGIRRKAKLIEQFDKQGDYSLWGLYNALTFVASHGEIKNASARERLLDQAAIMLERELTVKVEQ
jgi:hypothetical protein